MAEKGAEDITGPDVGQWQFSSWFRFSGRCFRESRFKFVRVKPRAIYWGVRGIISAKGCIVVSSAAEEVAEGIGNGVAEAETQVRLISYGFERLQSL